MGFPSAGEIDNGASSGCSYFGGRINAGHLGICNEWLSSQKLMFDCERSLVNHSSPLKMTPSFDILAKSCLLLVDKLFLSAVMSVLYTLFFW